MLNKLIKYLFGEKEVVREEESSTQEVLEEEKDPLHNVGEPVISFVKNFDKKNFTFEQVRCADTYDTIVKVKDKRNGEEFIYKASIYGNVFVTTPSFLTPEEGYYVTENLIKPVSKRRNDRVSAIKRKRKKLKEERERRRLKKLYCEEEA